MERRPELLGGEPHVSCIITKWNCVEGVLSYALLCTNSQALVELLGTRKRAPTKGYGALCNQRKG